METMLICAAQGGDRTALGRVLDRFRPYLLALANDELDPRLRARAGASDLVQDAFLHACHDFGDFRGGSGNEFKIWLRGILLHRIASNRRRHRQAKRATSREVGIDSIPEEDTPRDDTGPGAAVERSDRRQALLAAIRKLPEEYRNAVVWHHESGLSYEQIGQRLGRSGDAARGLYRRAMRRLELELQADHVL